MNSRSDSSYTVTKMLQHYGIGDQLVQGQWFAKDQVKLNGVVTTPETPVAVDDVMTVRGRDYRAVASAELGRLTLAPRRLDDGRRIERRVRVQCGYHKCLTMYFRRVSKKTMLWNNPLRRDVRHFFHRLDEFYLDCDRYNLCSVSGHRPDLDRFKDIRAIHIIRDPRDMIVSGYFYHKRSAESWCDFVNPTDDDWAVVNAPVPSALPADTSFSAYLNAVSVEEGLAAELEFRKHHFDSMMAWPTDDPRVLTVKYEDVVGNEGPAFRRIYDFFDFPLHTRIAAERFADRYSAKSERKLDWHIRNPTAGQWKDLFPSALNDRFDEQYRPLLEKYDY